MCDEHNSLTHKPHNSASNRLEECKRRAFDPICGKNSFKFHNYFLKKFNGRKSRVMCAKFAPNSAECRKLLPASGQNLLFESKFNILKFFY